MNARKSKYWIWKGVEIYVCEKEAKSEYWEEFISWWCLRTGFLRRRREKTIMCEKEA